MAKNNAAELDWKKGYGPARFAADLSAFKVATDHELEKAMGDAVLRVEAKAKENAPVDSGALRASIASAVEEEMPELKGVIGSNVVYAPYQELGTGSMEAQPYLRPALESEMDWIRKRFERAVKNSEDIVS